MTSPEEKDRARKGIKARQDAIKSLISKYQGEFDEMHARNRVAAGLSPRSAGRSKEQLKDLIRRQEERLEKWKKELELGE